MPCREHPHSLLELCELVRAMALGAAIIRRADCPSVISSALLKMRTTGMQVSRNKQAPEGLKKTRGSTYLEYVVEEADLAQISSDSPFARWNRWLN